MMTLEAPLSFFDTFVLGVVQGLTEFFPVSSDGHLALAEYFLGYHKESLVFDVLLHLGTLGSLFFVFHRETRELLLATFKRIPWFFQSQGRKQLVSEIGETRWVCFIWLTTFVTGVAGIILEPTIEALSSDIRVAGLGFLVTSAALFLASFKKTGQSIAAEMSWTFPLWIGLAQASALFTGVSRSGMTICIAILLGVQRREAGRFSFIAAIPIIALAVLYEARKIQEIASAEIAPMLVGILVAFIVGLLAIRGLMAMLTRLSLLPFAIYTLLLGLCCLIFGSNPS